jgi:hypothetical protein
MPYEQLKEPKKWKCGTPQCPYYQWITWIPSLPESTPVCNECNQECILIGEMLNG